MIRSDEPRTVARYTDRQRMNHWFIVLTFVVAALSGLALFHPSLYFLSALVGGGSWARILHPYFGLAMVLGFLLLFLALWRLNIVNDADRRWRAQIGRMLRGDKAGLPAAGRYNYGQKVTFWAMSISLLVLVVTGFMFWRPWFDPAFSIPVQRVAILLHSVAAVVLVLSVIVHVYAAIWINGTMRAMTRGRVTESWARRNHALWHDEVRQAPPPGATS